MKRAIPPDFAVGPFVEAWSNDAILAQLADDLDDQVCPSQLNELEAELIRVRLVKPSSMPQRPAQAPVQRTASNHQPAAAQPGTTAAPTPGAGHAGIPYQPPPAHQPQHTVPPTTQPPAAAVAHAWPAQASAVVTTAAPAALTAAPPPSTAAGAQALPQVTTAPQHSPQAPAASKETIDAGYRVFAAASIAGLDGQQKRMLQRLQHHQAILCAEQLQPYLEKSPITAQDAAMMKIVLLQWIALLARP